MSLFPTLQRFCKLQRKYHVLASVSDLKLGTIVDYSGKIQRVHSIKQQSQGAQRSVLLMIEMKEFKSGRKDSFRFNGDEKINIVKFDSVDAEFLYKDGETLHFMNPENFEQYELATDLIGSGIEFLTEGMVLSMGMHEGQPMKIELPNEVVAEVKETDTRLKSNPIGGNSRYSIC